MRRTHIGMLAVAMLATACTIPTEFPNWDTEWDLPVFVDDLGIDIADITLPAGITIDSTTATPSVRTGFSVEVSSAPAIVRTLGVQCPTCPNATAPKPAFTAPPATSTITLTSGSSLQSATLIGGSQIVVQVTNGFGFDPINPPGGSAGTVTLTVTNGAATLGTLTLQGPANTLPSGSTRSFTIPLAGTINTASPITVLMTMDSPAGAAAQPVTMNASQTFTVTSTPTIKVSTATVSLAANPIDPSSTGMDDLAEFSGLSKRVVDSATTQGAMILTITNPMTIGANAVLTFTGDKEEELPSGNTVVSPITPVVKNVVIPPGGAGTSTVTVNFTGSELRRLLGANVVATFTGATTAGTTAVTPTSRVTMAARIQMRFFVKEID